MDKGGQVQWQAEEARIYTHPLDVQLFADAPLFELLGDVSGKRILDIGCGEGVLLRKLRSAGAHVIGTDISEAMLSQASNHEEVRASIGICVASSDFLPFASTSFESAICSLTINNFPTFEITKRTFREAARILQPSGTCVITLPHPHTLDAKTSYRWTEWQAGQTQETLVPGEAFQRQIMGRNGKIMSIVNYYWPKPVLINLAMRAGFRVTGVVEKTASADMILQHSSELDPLYAEVPFFLVVSFSRNSGEQSGTSNP